MGKSWSWNNNKKRKLNDKTTVLDGLNINFGILGKVASDNGNNILSSDYSRLVNGTIIVIL